MYVGPTVLTLKPWKHPQVINFNPQRDLRTFTSIVTNDNFYYLFLYINWWIPYYILSALFAAGKRTLSGVTTSYSPLEPANVWPPWYIFHHLVTNFNKATKLVQQVVYNRFFDKIFFKVEQINLCLFEETSPHTKVLFYWYQLFQPQPVWAVIRFEFLNRTH